MSTASESIRQIALNLVGPTVRGRHVLLIGAAATSRRLADFFLDAAAKDVSFVSIDFRGSDTQRRFESYESVLTSPTPEFRQRLDAIDPGRSALVYAGSFTAVETIDGRPVLGSRTQRQAKAERKDEQVAYVGGAIHPVHADWRLDDFTAIQGVPRSGLAMSSSHTFIVPSGTNGDRIAQLKDHLYSDCDSVVVRPLHTGIPCTFYGAMDGQREIQLGPVEALVFWDPRTWRVRAPGIVWPLRLQSETLANARSSIHQICRKLHQHTQYCGAFGVDGVIRDGAFEIHEINPRVCAGISLFDKIVPSAAPLAAVDLVLREYQDKAASIFPPLGGLAKDVENGDEEHVRIFDGDASNSDRASTCEAFRRMGLVPMSKIREEHA